MQSNIRFRLGKDAKSSFPFLFFNFNWLYLLFYKNFTKAKKNSNLESN